MKTLKTALLTLGCLTVMTTSGSVLAASSSTSTTVTSGGGRASATVTTNTGRRVTEGRYESTIRTQGGQSLFVITTPSRPTAPLLTIIGVPGKPAKLSCNPSSAGSDYWECYDCGNQTIDDSTPLRGACDYIGFCTNGYNGNSSYCSF